MDWVYHISANSPAEGLLDHSILAFLLPIFLVNDQGW